MLRREAVFLGAAIALHGGILAGSRLVSPLVSHDAGQPIDVIELDTAPERRAPESNAPTETAEHAFEVPAREEPIRPRPALEPRRTGEKTTPDLPAPRPATPTETALPAATRAPRATSEFDPLLPADDVPSGDVPGLHGRPIYAIPGILPNSAPPAAAPTAPSTPTIDSDIAGAVLRKGLAQKDSQLGLELPAASNVAFAIVNAVRDSDPSVPTSRETALSGNLCADGRRMDRRSCPSLPVFILAKAHLRQRPKSA